MILCFQLPLSHWLAPAKVDTYALSDSVNVISQLNEENFYTPVVSSKWAERRDALDVLYKLSDVPKIANGDFSSVVRILLKVR